MYTPRMCVVLACLAVTPSLYAQLPASTMVVNGDFQDGLTGFTSTYVYREPATTTPNTVFDPGTFTLAPNLMRPIPIHSSPGLPDYYDHTYGNARGMFMVVNGSTVMDQVFWTTSVNVQPNNLYTFSMWLSVWNNSSNNLPQIQVSFNGAVAMIAVPPEPLGTWTNFTTTWSSGSETTVTIALQDNVVDYGGNDFGIDDISFSPSFSAVPEPTAYALVSVALAGVGGYNLLKRKRAKARAAVKS